jgi:hypothetical protein
MNSPFPLPRAVPITMKYDDGRYYLIGLQFETAAEAQEFANGLADFIADRGEIVSGDIRIRFRHRDGERAFLKTPAALNRDELGNCAGFN